jgi:hypothetical protein
LQRQDNTRVEWRTIVLAPNVAYTIRINDVVQVDIAGNTGPDVRYAETLVWVKRDGQWKVLIGHGSTSSESMWEARPPLGMRQNARFNTGR